jgi:hypothetical protein
MKQHDTRTIREMVEAWQYGTSIDESRFGGIAIVAMFDHDYEHHLLIQEWDFFADKPEWIYTLWFLGMKGTQLIHRWDSPADINRWREGHVPFVEAAGLVSSYRSSVKNEDRI